MAGGCAKTLNSYWFDGDNDETLESSNSN